MLTDAQLVAKYIELRNSAKAIEAQFEEDVKPYKSGMEAIEGMVASRMLEQGITSLKTESGTAYKVELTKFRVTDENAFTNYIIENRAWGLTKFTVLSEPAKEFVSEHQAPPPGVEITKLINTNFRKA